MTLLGFMFMVGIFLIGHAIPFYIFELLKIPYTKWFTNGIAVLLVFAIIYRFTNDRVMFIMMYSIAVYPVFALMFKADKMLKIYQASKLKPNKAI